MKKASKAFLKIPGTKYTSQNTQLLVSSGIPSLDELLGGGLPVGSLCVLEEDSFGTYSKVILKYFLAEGIVSKHPIFIASQDVAPETILSEVPAPIECDPEPSKPRINELDDNLSKMKIAFRYQNLPTSEQEASSPFGHYYDLSKHMTEEQIKEAQIKIWNLNENINGPNTFSNPAYHDVLQSIKKSIEEHKVHVKQKSESKTVLRIALNSVGSPMWLPNRGSMLRLHKSRDLDMFIYCLRALVHSALAVALITIPTRLYDDNSLGRCIHSADVAIKLQSFAGTDLENNPSLSDYNGYFCVTKMAAMNSFASKHPGSVEYAFKLRRKKFCIEKLHLPPDIQDATKSNEKDPLLNLGCGSSSKHLLEF